MPDAQVMSDLDATVAWAGKSSGGDIDALGITGFCWGGRIVWLYAAHKREASKAGVAWYGRLTGGNRPMQPTYPIDVAGELKAPVLGLYGGQDQGIPLADVERMREALAAAQDCRPDRRVPGRAARLPGGLSPELSRQREAADGWAQCLAWFRSHGVG